MHPTPAKKKSEYNLLLSVKLLALLLLLLLLFITRALLSVLFMAPTIATSVGAILGRGGGACARWAAANLLTGTSMGAKKKEQENRKNK